MGLTRILFIDAYDSFANNITALLFQITGAKVSTIRIDEDLSSVHDDLNAFFAGFDAIVLGPGPGQPHNAADIGHFTTVWKVATQHNIPVLGICLGFQSLCQAFEIPVVRMELPIHGHSMRIEHNNTDIFSHVGDVVATCYNSLAVHTSSFGQDGSPSRPDTPQSTASSSTSNSTDSGTTKTCTPANPWPDALKLLAWSAGGYAMAVRHVSLPFWGFQFHPESCLSSTACHDVLRNWWSSVKCHNDCDNGRLTHLKSLSPCQIRGSQHREDCNRSRSPDVAKALKRLLALTQSCPTNVQYMPLHLQCSSDRHAELNYTLASEQIANLCYSLSSSGRVALLESTKKGRFSIYAVSDESTWQLKYSNGTLHILRGVDDSIQYSMSRHESLDLIENFMLARQADMGSGSPDVPFWGGLIGFFSYEFGLDSLLDGDLPKSETDTEPDISLLWVDRSIVVDHYEKEVFVQSIRRDDLLWLTIITGKILQLGRSPTTTSTFIPSTQNEILSNTTISLPSRATYLSQIQSCLSHLHAGNSYELCLTTSSTITTPNLPHTAYNLYHSLRQTNPAPYSAYLHLNSTTILSSSPETFVSWSRHPPYTLSMIPMKGTLPRTPSTTLAQARTLLSTPKELAENQMIADLIRHDLYSVVSYTNLVEVIKLCEVLEFESVYQMVSHIRATLPVEEALDESNEIFVDSDGQIAKESEALADSLRRKRVMHYGIKALRMTLPPGSMTGAPKKRSCEILKEVEGRDRGVYSGVLGYLDVGGGGEWSVAIRCAWSCDEHANANIDANAGAHPTERNNKPEDGVDGTTQRDRSLPGRMTWHVGAGGAITVLSDPEAEWEEMKGKMDSVLRAFRPKTERKTTVESQTG